MIDWVEKQFISCLKQFFTIADLHNHRKEFEEGSPEEKSWLVCLKKIEKLAKDKTDDVMKGYLRHSSKKSKERIEEAKRRREVVEAESEKFIEAAGMKTKAVIVTEDEAKMVTEDNSNNIIQAYRERSKSGAIVAEDQIIEVAEKKSEGVDAKDEKDIGKDSEKSPKEEALVTDAKDKKNIPLTTEKDSEKSPKEEALKERVWELMMERDFTAAFSLALREEGSLLAPWLCTKTILPVADLSLGQDLLLTLLHHLSRALFLDPSQDNLTFMHQVVKELDREQWKDLNQEWISNVLKDVTCRLKNYTGQSKSRAVMLESLLQTKAGASTTTVEYKAADMVVIEDEAKAEMDLSRDETTDQKEVVLELVRHRASKMIEDLNFEGGFELALTARDVSLAPWICLQIHKPLADLSLSLPVLISLLQHLAAGLDREDKGARLHYMREVLELVKGHPELRKHPNQKLISKVFNDCKDLLKRCRESEDSKIIAVMLEAI
ncbi:unnamed protein product [Microthlaspi erraticum]|uniref:Uncharacterized protein n=1 Tax=Microthlaspi erraticum TaxID=1685480 RepID=A0A6D2KA14_9BRAS|nr:unnamed protein product [Microthlaspi erraticum]CAA7051185.1 unnamed protein product [Microthlaspi erraticum]